ncbi:MAG: right-handed parallel beta-helix repeat-containing protein [Paucimonas sp.]|nr:right-handed parallel beta-helix repeat-containing protein [Paucimonas sp.]
MTNDSRVSRLSFSLSAMLITGSIGLTACGGSGSDNAATPVLHAESSQTSSPTLLLSTTVSSSPLPMPANIVNGATVSLQCGRLYAGTLDLRGKSNVTVRTEGTCGKASLSPGKAVSGWTRHSGNIYSAPIGFEPVQLSLSGQPQSLAHWPNQPQTWVKAVASTSTTLTYAMPNADLVGATLVFRPFNWTIEARKITGYSGNVMTLGPINNVNFDGRGLSGTPNFYVEGKLWMLDQPGEWVARNGRLYVWAPDGLSPEGRVWASPRQHGIDATNSLNVTIDNVAIHGAENGIHAQGAKDLRVTRTDITNSSGNGIYNTGGQRLLVNGAVIRTSRFDGIIVKWGGGGESISNSRIESSANIGMPVAGHAGISLTMAAGSTVANNVVTNAGYIGIRAFRNAAVLNNTITNACSVLTDCGGIYVSAPDKLPLNTRIEGNTISNVSPTQRLSWGIYLDGGANAMTIAGNTVRSSANGLLIHNGFNNSVTGNSFAASKTAHVQMVESGSAASVRNNIVTGNSFTSRNGEETYRLSSDLGSTSVGQFATYDRNSYTSSSPAFANYSRQLLTYPQWKTKTSQDSASTFTP